MAHLKSVVQVEISPDENGKNSPLEISYRMPASKRSCTDILCFFIFITFNLAWFGMGYYAYQNGDVRKLASPVDSDGKICGRDETVKGKDKLMFFDITECITTSVFIFGCPTRQICVKNCPNEDWFSVDVLSSKKPVDWSKVRKQLKCVDGVDLNRVISMESFKEVIESGKCASYYVKSTPAIIFNYCLPDLGNLQNLNVSYFSKGAMTQNYWNILQDFVKAANEDVRKCWHLIILFVLVAAVITLFIILVMSVVAHVMIWTMLCVVIASLFYMTYMTYERYTLMPDDAGRSFNSAVTLLEIIKEYLAKKSTWLALFIVSSACTAGFAVLVIFLRKRITLAVMLISEASKAVYTMKSSLCFPVFFKTIQLAVVAYFVFIYLYLKSLGDASYMVEGLNASCACSKYENGDWCIPHNFQEDCVHCPEACVFNEIHTPKFKFYAHAYNFFALLWGYNFVSGFLTTILACCFAAWYWTPNKGDIPFFASTHATYVVSRYHLGSVAFGSFLLATCGFIRNVLEYLQKKAKKVGGGLMANCMCNACRCCFWIFERFLIFITANAYIVLAMTGKAFLPSAQKAFGLLVRNMVRVVVVDKVTDFLILMGKVAVVSFVAVLSHFTFTEGELKLKNPWVPICIVVLCAGTIVKTFFTVFSTAVDTIFLCFLKDGELNDGSQTKPYYMSQRLKNILLHRRPT